MSEDLILKLVLAIIGSNAFFTFLQFIIARRDNKKGMEKEMKALSEKMDRNQAVNARSHLLRFADELRTGCVHSIEYYKQTLLDAAYYETYCATHQDFSNGITEISIEYIKSKYREELDNGNLDGGQ